MKTQFSRYTLINILGLGIDALIVTLLTYTGALPLVAVAGGYYIAMGIVYLLHENWSFGHKQTNIKRALGFFFIASLVGLSRLPITHILTQANIHLSLTWIVAVGISFILNYFILSWFMEKTKTQVSSWETPSKT